MNSISRKYFYQAGMILLAFFFTSNNLRAQDSLSAFILTPKAGPEPHINSPKVFGVHPGHPIVFRIPVSGVKPITYQVDALPKGVKLDKNTGQLSGTIDKEGEYIVKVKVKNKAGNAERDF